MKKIALLLATLLLLGTVALTACGTDGTETDAESVSESASDSTTESVSESVSETESVSVTESETVADTKVTYTVTVKDQDGNPVANVAVQLCTSENCLLPQATGEDGVVTFKMNPDVVYQAKLNALPEGYTGDMDTYLDFVDNALTITITKN